MRWIPVSSLVAAFLVAAGCSVNLSGNKIGDIGSNNKVSDVGNNNGNGSGNNNGNNNVIKPSGNPAPTGLQNVLSLDISANGDTLYAGALPPGSTAGSNYDPTKAGASGNNPSNSSPVALTATTLHFDAIAKVTGNGNPITVPTGDSGFQWSFSPSQGINCNANHDCWADVRANPAAKVTIKVSWQGGKVAASKVINVVSEGAASVVAE